MFAEGVVAGIADQGLRRTGAGQGIATGGPHLVYRSLQEGLGGRTEDDVAPSGIGTGGGVALVCIDDEVGKTIKPGPSSSESDEVTQSDEVLTVIRRIPAPGFEHRWHGQTRTQE